MISSLALLRARFQQRAWALTAQLPLMLILNLHAVTYPTARNTTQCFKDRTICAALKYITGSN